MFSTSAQTEGCHQPLRFVQVLFPDLNNRRPQHFEKPKDILIIAEENGVKGEGKQKLGCLGRFVSLNLAQSTEEMRCKEKLSSKPLFALRQHPHDGWLLRPRKLNTGTLIIIGISH